MSRAEAVEITTLDLIISLQNWIMHIGLNSFQSAVGSRQSAVKCRLWTADCQLWTAD